MLAGIRVIDLAGEPGFLAGKILADLGADVIKLEPPGGDRAARRAPYLGGVEDPERSLVWLALNTSKRGVTLDLDARAGRDLFRRLVASADVVLETAPPAHLEARGLGFEALRAAQQGLVWCSITPFGRSGPYAGFGAGDLVVVAMGGNLAMTGDSDRPPVRCSMPTSQFAAGPDAALGILMALEARERTGRGDLVDVSLHECQLQSVLGGPGLHAGAAQRPRRAGARVGRTREIWAARDGHVSFGLRGGATRAPGLRALVAWMDDAGLAPDWLRDTNWEQWDPTGLDDAEIARLEDAFGAFFAAHGMRELYEGALERRILLAPCNDAAEVLAHRQLRARDFFVTLDYPELGASIEHPAFVARTDDGAARVRGRAPRAGEHSDEIYGELGLGRAEIEKLRGEGVI
ncbi:MAG: CoA transferase [Myxococcota bacterium]|nr:CoA transferase [Myxococcota bacterium]